MKRWMFVLAAMCCLVFAGCQKSPINGKLDGQWQVMSIVPEPAPQVAFGRKYYCFSLHVVQLTEAGFQAWTAGNMAYSGNKLTMEFPYAETSQHIRNVLLDYGITSNPVTFDVVKLDSKQLVLSNASTTITLRRF